MFSISFPTSNHTMSSDSESPLYLVINWNVSGSIPTFSSGDGILFSSYKNAMKQKNIIGKNAVIDLTNDGCFDKKEFDKNLKEYLQEIKIILITHLDPTQPIYLYTDGNYFAYNGEENYLTRNSEQLDHHGKKIQKGEIVNIDTFD